MRNAEEPARSSVHMLSNSSLVCLIVKLCASADLSTVGTESARMVEQSGRVFMVWDIREAELIGIDQMPDLVRLYEVIKDKCQAKCVASILLLPEGTWWQETVAMLFGICPPGKPVVVETCLKRALTRDIFSPIRSMVEDHYMAQETGFMGGHTNARRS